MRVNFGKQTWMYPMPVLIVGTYNEDGTPNAMNAAWGGIYDTDQIMLCLSHTHKTTENIRRTGSFTVSFADAAHVVQCDYLGIVSGNQVPDKISRAGFHAEKDSEADAPVFSELPMSLSCKLIKFNEDGIVIGQIVNVSADERILGENGKIDPAKLDPIVFDSVNHTYLRLGETVGNAFSDGKKLK